MAMNKISQIPTEKNVTHLFNIFSDAWCQRNIGMPVSAREVQIKETAYQTLFKKSMFIKYLREC